MKKLFLYFAAVLFCATTYAQEIVVASEQGSSCVYSISALRFFRVGSMPTDQGTTIYGDFYFEDGDIQRIENLSLISFSNIVDGIAQAEETGVSIYPNPATDLLMLDNAQAGTIRFYNLSGALVMQENIAEGSQAIAVSSLPQGVYLVQVNNTLFKLTKK